MTTVKTKSIELEITAENTFSDPIEIDDEESVQIFAVGTGTSAPEFGATVVTLQTRPKDWTDSEYIDFGQVVSGANPPEQSQSIRPASESFVRFGVKLGDFDTGETVKIRLTV